MLPDPSNPSEPLLHGNSNLFPLSDIILALSRRHVTGVLNLEPSGLRFFIHDGYLDAVSGVEPLGHVLLHMGLLEAHKLRDFRPEEPTPLGLSLVKQGKIELYDLWLALSNQARIGIGRMLRLKNQSFTFVAHQPLPGPSARLDIPEILLETIQLQSRREGYFA